MINHNGKEYTLIFLKKNLNSKKKKKKSPQKKKKRLLLGLNEIICVKA